MQRTHSIRFMSLRWATTTACCTLAFVAGYERVLEAHTTENSLPLAYVGFSSPFGIVGDATYTDVWGAGDTAYLGTTQSGVGLVDISNPSRTSLVSTYLPNAPYSFDSIQVHDQVGFWASSDGGGLHIVDVQNSAAPQTLATVNASHGATDTVNGFAISNDLLFMSDASSQNIFVYDISSRNAPQSVGRIETGETISIHDIVIDDNALFAAGLGGRQGDGATYIYDISGFRDNGASEVAYFESGDSSAYLGKTEDDMLIVSQQRVGGALEVWDVTDLSTPQILTRANASDFGVNAYSTGEVFVRDQFVYVAWHQEGVQLLDLDNIRSMSSINRIGHYDTSPNTSPLDGFTGNVGVYVYPGHERVLLSDTRWGLYIVDASGTIPVEGDFDGNGVLEVSDLDQLTAVVIELSHAAGFDLNGDGLVTGLDRERWIFDLFDTTYGDSNLDRVFNSSDLIIVFQAAEYEDGLARNSTWTTGDWNGDREFDSGDIVFAFQTGGYRLNATPHPHFVPEPNICLWTLLSFCFLLRTQSKTLLTSSGELL